MPVYPGAQISRLHSSSERTHVNWIERNRNLSVKAWFRQLDNQLSLLERNGAEISDVKGHYGGQCLTLNNPALVLDLPRGTRNICQAF